MQTYHMGGTAGLTGKTGNEKGKKKKRDCEKRGGRAASDYYFMMAKTSFRL